MTFAHAQNLALILVGLSMGIDAVAQGTHKESSAKKHLKKLVDHCEAPAESELLTNLKGLLDAERKCPDFKDLQKLEKRLEKELTKLDSQLSKYPSLPKELQGKDLAEKNLHLVRARERSRIEKSLKEKRAAFDQKLDLALERLEEDQDEIPLPLFDFWDSVQNLGSTDSKLKMTGMLTFAWKFSVWSQTGTTGAFGSKWKLLGATKLPAQKVDEQIKTTTIDLAEAVRLGFKLDEYLYARVMDTSKKKKPTTLRDYVLLLLKIRGPLSATARSYEKEVQGIDWKGLGVQEVFDRLVSLGKAKTPEDFTEKTAIGPKKWEFTDITFGRPRYWYTQVYAWSPLKKRAEVLELVSSDSAKIKKILMEYDLFELAEELDIWELHDGTLLYRVYIQVKRQLMIRALDQLIKIYDEILTLKNGELSPRRLRQLSNQLNDIALDADL